MSTYYWALLLISLLFCAGFRWDGRNLFSYHQLPCKYWHWPVSYGECDLTKSCCGGQWMKHSCVKGNQSSAKTKRCSDNRTIHLEKFSRAVSVMTWKSKFHLWQESFAGFVLVFWTAFPSLCIYLFIQVNPQLLFFCYFNNKQSAK